MDSVNANIVMLEGNVKFRDGKKWKSRWCVMRKLSPVADCLHLQLYRDSKDRYNKHTSTKASLSLQHFLALETAFTLDKESNTMAIICQDVIVVLAFDTRERLIMWQVKINNHLGEGKQFCVQIFSTPAKSKINNGPANLHVQQHKFCLTSTIPPKLLGSWEIKHLRRFGIVDGKFCFEGGSLCGRGEGLYIFSVDDSEEVACTIRLAAEGKLHSSSRRRQTSSSSSCSSSRKYSTGTGGSVQTEDDYYYYYCKNLTTLQKASGAIAIATATVDRTEIRGGGGGGGGRRRINTYNHSNSTTSLSNSSSSCHSMHKIPIAQQQNDDVTSYMENLTSLSQPPASVVVVAAAAPAAPAAVVPDTANASSIAAESKLCLSDNYISELDYNGDSCYVSVSQGSKYSDGGSSCASMEYSRADFPLCSCQHSRLFDTRSSSSSSSISPQKSLPNQYNHFHSRYDINSSSSYQSSSHLRYRNYLNSIYDSVTNDLPAFAFLNANKLNSQQQQQQQQQQNTIVPSSYSVQDVCDSRASSCQCGSCTVSVAPQQPPLQDELKSPRHYDTPKSIKLVDAKNMYANYDVPPKQRACNCHAALLQSAAASVSVSASASDGKSKFWTNDTLCLYKQLFHCTPRQSWQTLPTFHNRNKNQWPRESMTAAADDHCSALTKENAIYAQIDVSKKVKNRNTKGNTTSRPDAQHEQLKTYDRLSSLNYMNLEFTNSLEYYENVREVLHKWKKDVSGIESLNIDIPATARPNLDKSIKPRAACSTGSSHHSKRNENNEIVVKVEDAAPSKEEEEEVPTTVLLEQDSLVENYVPMSSLKLTAAIDLQQLRNDEEQKEQNLKKDEGESQQQQQQQALAKAALPEKTAKEPALIHRYCCRRRRLHNSANSILDTAATEKTDNETTTFAYSSELPTKINANEEKSGHSDMHHQHHHRLHEVKPLCVFRKPSEKSSGNRRRPPFIDAISSEIVAAATAAESNRDSSSSNDSGFSTASSSFKCNRTHVVCSSASTIQTKQHHSSNGDHSSKLPEQHFSPPRRSKSSDPLKDLTFRFHKEYTQQKSSSAEAELPLCFQKDYGTTAATRCEL